MHIRTKPAYSFDDVLLVPQHSTVFTRKSVDLSTKLGKMSLELPIISANMDTVTEDRMAVAMGRAGGAGALHRFASIEDQTKWINTCGDEQVPAILSIGLNKDDFKPFLHLVESGAVNAICLDVAHGDHVSVCDVIEVIRQHFPNIDIIAGNVATEFGAMRLVNAGANVIKVGIGPGSVCSTRTVSGHGFPQLSAVYDIHQKLTLDGVRDKTSIIADGGIRYPGDIVKALAAGADAVMLGSLLAGTDEAAGERVVENGVAYKTYRGMASYAVQKEKRKNRTPRVEGVSAKVPYRGPVVDTLDNLEAGIRSGLSYSGALDLAQLRDVAEFVVVTGNTVKESSTHHPYKL